MNHFSEIPKEKLEVKIRKTVLGFVFIAFAGVAIWQQWPWYVAAGALVLGANVISNELMKKAFQTLGSAVRDLMKGVKGA